MTNLVFLAHNRTAPQDSAKVILRIFGSGSTLFSRHQERGIFLAASRLGVGPHCIIEFSNGRVEQFLPGNSVTATTMRHQNVAAAIAVALADFHVRMLQTLPFTKDPLSSSSTGSDQAVQGGSPRSDESGLRNALWDRLRGWIKAVHDVAPESATALGVGPLSTAEKEVATMQHIAETAWGPCWLAFTHNDLQYGNVLLCLGNNNNNKDYTDSSGNDFISVEVSNQIGNNIVGAVHGDLKMDRDSTAIRTTTTATLIDYEYSTVGEVAFDIANHFCEYAADYHAANEADVLDWHRMPSPDERAFFCIAYCEALLLRHPNSPLATTAKAAAAAVGSGNSTQIESKEESLSPMPCRKTETTRAAIDEELMIDQVAEVLAKRVEAFLPLSHLKWGLWGLIQSKLSDVGFNYLGYAEARLQQYHKTKKILLENENEKG